MAISIQRSQARHMSLTRLPSLLPIWLQSGIAAVCLLLTLPPGICAETALPENTTAPAFALKDAAGVRHTLAEYRGRSVVILFACGCQWCHDFGLEWGQMQRTGVLADAVTPPDPIASPLAPEKTPLTLVVYMGDAMQTRLFAQAAGLDLKQTVLFPDPDLKITRQYRAMPCPRLYVLESKGRLRYVNRHADDIPRKASATVLVSKAVDGLRRTLLPLPSERSAPTQKRTSVTAPKSSEQTTVQSGPLFHSCSPLTMQTGSSRPHRTAIG